MTAADDAVPRRDRVVRTALTTLAFALAYAAATLLGRASQLPGLSLAVVWPAAGVGFVWMARAWRAGRWSRWRDGTLLTATGLLVQVLSGQPVHLALPLAVASLLQAVVACWTHQRLQPSGFRLRGPGDLWALLVAAVLGACAGAAVGASTAVLLLHASPSSAYLAWIVRHTTGTVVLAVVWLRIGDRRRSPVRGAGWVEHVVVLAACGGFFAWMDHTRNQPLTFLLVPWAVWLGLRAGSRLAIVITALNDVVLIVLTRVGGGPFVWLAPQERVVDVQLLVVVLTVLTVMLVLHREERHRLEQTLRRSSRDARQQSLLLGAVFDATSDGLSVYDPAGVAVIRNHAAHRLFPDLPEGLDRSRWGEHFELLTPEGAPWPAEDLPVARALRGEHVTDVDMLVRTPATPAGRLLNLTAHPLSTGTRPATAVPAAPGTDDAPGADDAPGGELSPLAGGVVLAARDVTAERAAAAQIARARDLFAGVLAAATEQSIIGCDHDGTVVLFNTGAERMLGHRAQDVVGRSLAVVHDEAEIVARAAELGVEPGCEVFVLAAREGRTETRQWTYVTADGRRLQVMLSLSPLHDGEGRCIGTIGVASDITDQLAAQARLAGSERRFRLAFDTAPVGMMIVGLTGTAASRILQVNETLSQFTGLSAAELLDRDFHDLTHPDDRAGCMVSFAPFLLGEVTRAQEEKRYQHADGSTRWGMLSATVMSGEQGGAGGGGDEPHLLCLIEDVTARKAAEEALRHQALHDALTGLPNRVLLRDRLEHALAAASRSAEGVGVLFCDLDGFKDVNDSAGHGAGDELLRQVADRFSTCLRPGDTLARLGGDEFAVVCPGVHGPQDLAVVAQRLLACLREPITIAAGTFAVGVSIGTAVAEAERDGGSAAPLDPLALSELVLAHADAAMYAAKRAGKNRAHAHSDEPDPTAVPGARSARLLPHLRSAGRAVGQVVGQVVKA